MDQNHEMKKNGRTFGVRKVMAVGLPFLVAGMLFASGFQWTPPSVAGDYTSGPHVTATAAPEMPSSFAELADKMSPTVVNIKVTKVEKAVFQGHQMPEGPFGDLFERFFKEMPQMPDSRRSQGAGSGVILVLEFMNSVTNP